jgi:polysaccharide export outer membrane protein
MCQRCTTKQKLDLSLVALAVCAALGGCADGGSLPSERASALRGAQLAEPRLHKLNVGDKIKVSVFGEPDLSGIFDINAAGAIALPLAGDVPAKGLSPAGLRDAIVRRLSEGYLKNPKVSVEVATFRPIFIHGEVRSGGEFAFKHGLKIRDAIAVAGGYTYRANQGYVLITRGDEPRELRVDLPNDALVMPGDNIRVPERFF